MRVSLAQLQAFDRDHDVLRAFDLAGGAINRNGVVDVFLDLFGLQKLAHVEVSIAFAGRVVELIIVGTARMEQRAARNKFALEETWQRRGAAVAEINRLS